MGREPDDGRRGTIGLAMIVRDEAAVVERCLESVRPLIDTWTIVDTGSLDDTRERIQRALGDLPGRLHDRPWVDFGTNRSQLLDLARGTADYLLLVDADQTVRIEGRLPELDGPGYLLVHDGSPRYKVPRLIRGDLSWRYVGTTHEYLDGGEPIHAVLPELVIEHHADGGSRRDKFTRDRRLLEQAVSDHPDDPRSAFYLAQTYADLGEVDLAIDEYRRRIALGGWDEERFYSQLRIGELLRADDWDRAVPELLHAWELRPGRAEPLYRLANGYRTRGQHWLAAVFARTGLGIPYPEDDLLFVDPEPYDWGLRFELSISAYWSGHADESLRESEAILAGHPPDWLVPWVIHNRDAARQILGGIDDPPSTPGATRPGSRSGTAPLLAELAEGTTFELLSATDDPHDDAADWPVFNPCISDGSDGLVVVLRRSNYRRDPDGTYHLIDGSPAYRTRNRFSLRTRDGQVRSEHTLPEIPTGAPTYPSPVVGVEDLRVVPVDGSWIGLGTCRDRSLDTRCQMIVWDLGAQGRGDGPLHLLAAPGIVRHEKNWMPFVVDGALCAVYSCHPLVVLSIDPSTGATTEVSHRPGPDLARWFRGGSQGVERSPGRWRFLVHEVSGTSEETRRYTHRFVDLAGSRANGFELVATSRPFSFVERRIEFGAGLAAVGDDLVCSFGVDDAQAMLVRIPVGVVDDLMQPTDASGPDT